MSPPAANKQTNAQQTAAWCSLQFNRQAPSMPVLLPSYCRNVVHIATNDCRHCNAQRVLQSVKPSRHDILPPTMKCEHSCRRRRHGFRLRRDDRLRPSAAGPILRRSGRLKEPPAIC